MRTLNIIGAGRLGRTLGRLWQDRQVFRVGAVCNSARGTTEEAAHFIAAGHTGAIPRPCSTIAEMPPADCWLVGTGDSRIAAIAHELAPRMREESAIVFHCSGALDSSVLSPCRPALLASAHPVHSFAEPEQSLQTLAGSTVALEGDNRALDLLRGAFAALDCGPLELAGTDKPLYHAASVLACNYLTTLLDLSLRAYAAAGIEQARALEMLAPILTQTLDNNLRLGPEASLTGPVARGDLETVAGHLAALEKAGPTLLRCYRELGRACVQLAERGGLDHEAATRLEQLLSEPKR